MSNGIRRILVVDDNLSIHEDFRKIFYGIAPRSNDLDQATDELFGGTTSRYVMDYELEFASQGQQALEMVREAVATQKPYAMAFMDVQMPPGWDGIETMTRIWEIAPEMEMVVCTAYSTYSLPDMIQKTGRLDGFVVLKKPFDSIEVLQLANTFCEKWQLLNEVKERARKLEESQRQYRFLAEATPNLLWTTKADGNVKYVNQRWCDFTGLTAEQSKDAGWTTALHPDDVARCLNRWTESLRTGGDFEIEYRLQRAADGGYRWFLGRGVAMRNEQGEVLHWVGTCTDIDDKKRAEEDLRHAYETMERRVVERTSELSRSETRYRELINGQGEGVVYTDADLKFTFANPAAEQLLGLWPGQLVGKKLDEFIDEKNKAIVQQQLNLRHRGQKTSYELEVKDARGERRQVLITGSPQFNAEGELCGTFAIYRDITQRKNAEVALRESQRLLRAVLDNIPDPAWLKDAQGRYLVGNKPLATVYRRTVEEIVGKTIGEVFPAFADHLTQGDEKVASSGKQVRSETCLPDGDGKMRWFDTIETPIFNESGKLAGTVGIARDITERRQMEEALRGSENRYRELLNSQDDGVMLIDAHQRLTFANPASGRIFELATEALVGRSLWEFLDDDGKKVLEREVEQGKSGKKSSYELEIIAANGERRQLHVNATPRRNGEGQVCGAFAVIRDITERKRTEEKLHLQTSALSAAANGIVITDRCGKILWVNPAFTHLTGYSAEEAVGSTPAFLKSGEHPDSFYEEMWKTILDGRAWHGELVNRRKDGTKYHEEMTITPVKDERNMVKNFVGVKRDVTEKKREAKERRALDLQLQQAQKMEAVGQLAAGIAHEINTPTQYVGDNTRFLKDAFGGILTALQGYTELIAAAKQNAVTPELITKAEEVIAASDMDYHFEQIPAAINETLEGVERVTKIVRAMKEFSHPGGREKNGSNINKAIESTVTVARNEWKYVAEMVLDLDRNLPLVPCFISEFNQAVLNLVINAAHAIGDVVRATPGGGKAKITIRTRRDGDFAEVRVSDTGTGIPEQHRQKIFEPFFTTKDVGKGTGQGLTVVYSAIVKKHDGTVTFETETGKGTTFIIRVPICCKTQEAVAVPEEAVLV